MSDTTDDMEAWSGYLEFEDEREEQQRQDARIGIWTCKGGKEVKIARMDNDHLCNTTRLLRRKLKDNPDWANIWLETFEEELTWRGIEA